MTPSLSGVLREAQSRGLVGPREIDWHIAHAERYLASIPQGARCVDLGSGGGLPGLPVAVARPDLVLTLVDARDRAAQWLRYAVAQLRLTERVTVVHARAEALVMDHRGAFDVVMARGFGPPADLAECAAPLLRVGGRLVVSAVDAGEAWPAEGLARLGLGAPTISRDEFGAMVVVACVARCDRRFPRRAKARLVDPLWS